MGIAIRDLISICSSGAGLDHSSRKQSRQRFETLANISISKNTSLSAALPFIQIPHETAVRLMQALAPIDVCQIRAALKEQQDRARGKPEQ